MNFVLIAVLLAGSPEPLDLSKLNLNFRSSDEKQSGRSVPEKQIFTGEPGSNLCLPLKTWFTIGFGTKVRLESPLYFAGSVVGREGILPRPRALIMSIDGARETLVSLEDPIEGLSEKERAAFEDNRRKAELGVPLALPPEWSAGDAGVVTEFLTFQVPSSYPGTVDSHQEDACLGVIVPRVFAVPPTGERPLAYDRAPFKEDCPACSTTDFDELLETVQGQSELDEGGVLHSVELPFDGKLETAWCEDNAYAGIGHKFGFELAVNVHLEGFYLHGGYFKSAELLKQNNRLKRARVRINGKEEFDFALEDPALKPFEQVTAKPVYVRLPAELRDQHVRRMSLMILEVYKGTKYDDTCVSEVRPIISPPRKSASSSPSSAPPKPIVAPAKPIVAPPKPAAIPPKPTRPGRPRVVEEAAAGSRDGGR